MLDLIKLVNETKIYWSCNLINNGLWVYLFIGYKKSHGQGPLMYLGETNRFNSLNFKQDSNSK